MLDSYFCDGHLRRRSNKWMAFSRWPPVWRQATPTCHSQMTSSGRWTRTWSSVNICLSISNPGVRQVRRQSWTRPGRTPPEVQTEVRGGLAIGRTGQCPVGRHTFLDRQSSLKKPWLIALYGPLIAFLTSAYWSLVTILGIILRSLICITLQKFISVVTDYRHSRLFMSWN